MQSLHGVVTAWQQAVAVQAQWIVIDGVASPDTGTNPSNMACVAQTSHKTAAAGIMLIACLDALPGLQEKTEAFEMRQDGLKLQIASLQRRLQKSQAGEGSAAQREVLLKTQLQREQLHASVNALKFNRLELQMELTKKVRPEGIDLFVCRCVSCYCYIPACLHQNCNVGCILHILNRYF